MNYAESVELFCQHLTSLYSEQEMRSLIRIWADHTRNGLYSKLLSEPAFRIKEDEIRHLQHFVGELQKHIPYQYVLGYTDFCSLRFEVNSATLIPRPETEELVYWILSRYKSKNDPISILDVGTGSGCIAISLAQHLPNSTVYALDNSSEALDIAKLNAQKHAVNVLFECDDMRLFKSKVKYDIIVSNPPYVKELEKKKMKENVLLYEPHQALFVPNHDPLIYYKALAQLAKDYLKSTGGIYAELNEKLSAEVADLFTPFAKVE
ncbi:MAG: peptide chain release factor N(5)-glutamine methyltransferase, partial [Bacteroidetes bacterium]|nr:peptide chain release factor N(5)-glutamine methyltransferase [Bacteroidota bacterium]